MKSARTLPAVLLLAALASASSCEKDKKTKVEYQYAVTLTAELALDLRYPNDRTRAQTCPGTQSWLVRLDETGDGTWEYSLLFNSDFSALYGCSTGECADLTLGLTMTTPPARAMLEGLTIAPDLYADAAGGIDVTCRGIADTAVVAGDITTEALPTPTDLPDPGPEPTAIPASRHTLTLRMLTVGNSNPLPYVATAAAPPQLRFGVAAGFSNYLHGIAMDPSAVGAGRVVFAGGMDAANALEGAIWEFEPRTLTFTQTTNLGIARVGLTATTFVDEDGQVGIVFAGGATSVAPKSRHADVYWSSGMIESNATALQTDRAFHSATFFPRAMDGPVIGLIGGGDYNPATNAFGGNETNTSEYFLPKGSVSSDNCLEQTTWQFCVPNGTQNLAQARMRHGATFYEAGGGSDAWVAGGQQGATGRSDGQVYTAGDVGLPGGAANLVGSAVAPVAGLVTTSGNSALDLRPITIGGYTDGNPSSSIAARSQGYYREAGGAIRLLSDTLTFARGDATATALRDKTLLIAGGRNDAAGLELGILPVERLIPSTSTTPAGAVGTFEFLALPGATCTDGTGGGCAALRSPRYGHTATRLDATATWLDGAVLVIGGAASTEPTAELFVPALTCDPADHLTPVSPVTHVPVEPLTNASLPALCDRDRAGEPITAPDNPPL